MKKYENKLKELQKIELEILEEFIKTCDKLKLDYYLYGGTLLGSIRHKGFIPWDDDIDVCMFRKDYEKFIKHSQKILNKKYFLQTYETDSEYPNCFAKIRNSETTFIETSLNDKKINHGIYIDIFPLDNYHNLTIYEKINKKLINYQLFKTPISKIIKKNILKKIIMLISNLIYGKKTSKELCIIKDNIYQKNNNNNSNLITNFNGAWGIEKETYSIEDFQNSTITDFEKLKCKIPIGYENILIKTYGDYMKLPPKEQRIAHHYADIIDSKKSYKKYIKNNNIIKK